MWRLSFLSFNVLSLHNVIPETIRGMGTSFQRNEFGSFRSSQVQTGLFAGEAGHAIIRRFQYLPDEMKYQKNCFKL